MVVMTMLRRAKKLRPGMAGLAAATAALVGASIVPAAGEITKLLIPCQERKLCPAYRASITPPDGWRFDAEAERRHNVQMLVPKTSTFDDAGAIIYAIVTYNPNKRSIADFVAEDQAKWRTKSPDVKITPLADVSRSSGREPFRLFHYELPGSTVQPFERIATTVDSDKDGNGFLVGIVLSAKSMKALDDAERAYLAVLTSY